MKYLLIGYGNTLRSDDGIGPAVAEWFQAEAEAFMGGEADALRIVAVPQLVPELAELIAEAERVVLVDASHGLAPGAIDVRRVEPSPVDAETRIHAYDPATLAAWAGRLYGNAPEIHVVAVGTQAFGFGQGLTPKVAEAVPRVARAVADLFLDERPAEG